MTGVQMHDDSVEETVTELSTLGAAKDARKRWRSVRRVVMVNLSRVVLLVAFLMLWQVASGRWVDQLLVSRPSDIWHRLVEWLGDGTIAHNAGTTLWVAFLGFVVGATLAAVMGILLGGTVLGTILDPFFAALYSLPRLALAPLFILWFGIGAKMAVAFTAFLVFFIMYSNCYSGAENVDRSMVAAVRIMGAKRRQVLRYVVIPSALVWVAAALKVAIPYALVGAVVAEMLAGNRGLGYLVARSAGVFDTAGSFAALSLLLVAGLLANFLSQLLTSYFLRWRGDRHANAGGANPPAA